MPLLIYFSLPTEKREFQAMTLEPCHVSTACCMHKAVVQSYCLIFRLACTVIWASYKYLPEVLRLVSCGAFWKQQFTEYGVTSYSFASMCLGTYVCTYKHTGTLIAICHNDDPLRHRPQCPPPLRSVMFTYRYEQRLRESPGTIRLSSFLAICC